ncbi:sucrase ferredoxin [Iningainema tapete]|uniref:Sucrase ferredoxin n=1 Tax=Iningainema tapete BLCC-T55 TaxID=2748662 RepID=A0A8J6XJC5_9CYAN|nr:sucrase ferredoxin [Iningainema tapete]MBD2773531.1 sucrase ferredoxin [Iningainema tapete BLCC-T55]
MNTFFCSDHSKQAGEDIIGSASNHQTYILVECPQPWLGETFNSKWVSENLRTLVEEVKQAKLPIRFLLIANSVSHKADSTTLLIYHRKDGLGNGYRKLEFKLKNIEQVATVVRRWLKNGNSDEQVETKASRDILICTHGSVDMCCARYGTPFYHQAANAVANLGINNVRIWKSSHFGGHRFAPTAIDLPEGRYYGVLDADSFNSILTRTGNITCLNKVYRGWGILSSELQVLEREIMLQHGWDWFDYKVAARIIEENLDNDTIQAELTLEKPDGELYTYQASLIKYDTKKLQIKGSCKAKQEYVFPKYAVASLSSANQKLVVHENVTQAQILEDFSLRNKS